MSLQIARIKGIPIRLHFTLLIAFILISWTVAVRFTPQIYTNLTSLESWMIGIIGATILFVSVLLHELAHSIIALRYGLRVREIILFVFGGVSNIEDVDRIGERKERSEEDVSKEFRQEFKIAAAGPITSFAIAAILMLFLLLISQINTQPDFVPKRITVVVLWYGTLVNTLLGLFNLIPAFPLDGGRILRASLLKWKRDYGKATKIAARVGIIISYGFMGLGFIAMLYGGFISGIWIILIGWFLNSGAQSYLAQYELSSNLRGVYLRDIMNTKIISIREAFTINKSLMEYFNRYVKDSFPVVDNLGYLLGMVTFKDAWNVPEDKRDDILVRDIMIPVTSLIIMPNDGEANQALTKMTKRKPGRIFVCDGEGKLVGLVSKTELVDSATDRKEVAKVVGKLENIKDGFNEDK